ncbi:MAG: lamin tail domain-containing protein, partial [Clostridia bacterium]|nr:lamin tail domain-containing protein [Clostridia bacterium]
MNNRQKQKRALLAVILTVLLVVIIVLATAISCCAAKDVAAGRQQANTKVIVSEILVSNKQAVRDPMGTYSDYFELHNISGERVNLSGYGVSDDETSMWVIADGTFIEPDEYLVFWCAGKETGITNVTNFALSKDDVLRFSDPSGKPIITIDLSKSFSGLSLSYIDSGEWVNMAPTPGYPNTEEGVAAYERSRMADSELSVQETTDCPVRVTELMAANGNAHKGPDGTYCDWIELYNASSTEFDLSGFGLSDDITKPKKYKFPEGTKIGAYSYLVLYHTEKPVDGVLCIDFGLSAQGETLVFTSKEDRIIDLIEFGAQQRNYSLARVYINGMFDASAGFEPTDKPTPGFDNTANGYYQFDEQENGEMGVHDIRMNEVLVNGYHITYALSNSTKSQRPYDADYGSWIELYNQSDTTLDVSGYTITDNINKPRKWVFPDGTSIAAKGYLVLQLEGSLPRDGQSAKDITADQRKYTLNFDIAAAGETLYLFDGTGLLIDRVSVPKARACISYGRDASGAWKLFDTPTEGAPNSADGRGLYCEEAQVDTPSGIYTGTQTVNITVPDGCYATYTLSCGKENDPVKTTAPTMQSDRVGGPIAIKENTVLRVRT